MLVIYLSRFERFACVGLHLQILQKFADTALSTNMAELNDGKITRRISVSQGGVSA